MDGYHNRNSMFVKPYFLTTVTEPEVEDDETASSVGNSSTKLFSLEMNQRYLIIHLPEAFSGTISLPMGQPVGTGN